MRDIRGIIFDVDGVLVDSELVFVWSVQRFLAEQGIEETTRALGRYIGSSEAAIVDAVQAEYGLTHLSRAQVEDGIYGSKSGYARFGDLPPLPGLVDFLVWVRGRGVRTGIATSGTVEHVRTVLADTGLMDSFDVMATVEDAGVCKPDPTVYRLAADRLEALGVPRAQMIAVEDSPAGIAAAQGAGLLTVGLSVSEIVQDTSAAVVRSATYEDLRAWLEA